MAKITIGGKVVTCRKKPSRRGTTKKRTTKKTTKKTKAVKRHSHLVHETGDHRKEGRGSSSQEETAKRFEVSNKSAAEYKDHIKSTTIRDIVDIPPGSHLKRLNLKGINWERRLACKNDPILDLETYMPKVFYLSWADFHKELIHAIETSIQDGGKKAFGLPRGSGKTAITRGMIIRATKYGMRNFAFFIGSKENKALQTLSFVRGYWYRNQLLQQDFPEIAYPVYRIDGRAGPGNLGQIYRGERTHISWSTREIQYPTMMFTEEDVAGYLEHDPDCVTYLPDINIDIDRFIINSSGCVIRVAGIDGSIRGEADLHPVLLTQPRPDLVLLDDVQKEQKSKSVKGCEDLEALIENAVDHLSAPDVSQACLMPCTVINEGDVSDRYLSPLEKPDWHGERHGIISKYPPGFDDELIYEELDGKPNKQAKLWIEYQEIREHSLRAKGNLILANEFYLKNLKAMKKGFKVTWEDRFKADSKDTNKNEIDALQSAMNWRFKNLASFLSEGQNKPRSRTTSLSILLTPTDVAGQVTNLSRGEISPQWQELCAFIDVQDEILFWMIFAFDRNFNGQFIDYGTFPESNSPYFRKSQTFGWSLLTRGYFRENPEERARIQRENPHERRLRAPFEAKLRLALERCTAELLSRDYIVQDGNHSIQRVKAIAIDTRWGKSSGVIKRFVRENADNRIICYLGHPFVPSHRQLEEYTMTDGWLFEHQQFPHVREAKWVIKPFVDGGRYILADVNRLKSFLMARLATPVGSEGAVTLFRGLDNQHRMAAEHIAGSEYPEPISARGIIKDCWQIKPEARQDNDYLDCAAGCMCLASICGASLKTNSEIKPPVKRSLRDAYARRQNKARR